MKKYNILLVEDCLDFTYVIERLLKKSRHRIVLKISETLSEAKEALSKEAFDLIILDLNLSDSFGVNSLEEIKKLCPETAIIVLTGIDENDMGLKSIQLGAQDYITKDNLNEHNISRIIKYAVERQRLKNRDLSKESIKNFYKSLQSIETYVSNPELKNQIDETYKKFIKFSMNDTQYYKSKVNLKQYDRKE